MSATGSRSQGGFTLIECLAVLAITALASAIAFPSLERALSGAYLAQSRQALMANLRQARGLALSSGEPEALIIAPDGDAYGWNGEITRALPPSVRLSEDGGAIAFYPDGSTSPGRVVLSSGAGRALIEVSPIGVVAADTAPAAPPT